MSKKELKKIRKEDEREFIKDIPIDKMERELRQKCQKYSPLEYPQP